MENNSFDFNRYQRVLCGWYDVLCSDKWANKTALIIILELHIVTLY